MNEQSNYLPLGNFYAQHYFLKEFHIACSTLTFSSAEKRFMLR